MTPGADLRAWQLRAVARGARLRPARGASPRAQACAIALYRFARIEWPCVGAAWRPVCDTLGRAARFIAHNSLTVYNAHLAVLIVYCNVAQ